MVSDVEGFFLEGGAEVIFKGILPSGMCYTVLNNKVNMVMNSNMEGSFSSLF